MASKRKVTQDDLRKMMADMKSNPSKSSTVPKKLKLSSRELALMEEEKRKKALRDQEKIRLKQEKMARVVPNQGLQPKKSILKNTGSSSNYSPPQFFSPQSLPKKQASIKEPDESPKRVEKETKATEEEIDEESGALPEGFFDDPKLDAKARNVQYVDQGEEEWNKFQKEIADEMIAAQEILVEDRNEATADRQLEDIDEQIQAWQRVANLEQKKEAVSQSKAIPSDSKTNESDDDEEDVDLDDLSDWRKKS